LPAVGMITDRGPLPFCPGHGLLLEPWAVGQPFL
jgi:hypothetical protein